MKYHRPANQFRGQMPNDLPEPVPTDERAAASALETR